MGGQRLPEEAEAAGRGGGCRRRRRLPVGDYSFYVSSGYSPRTRV